MNTRHGLWRWTALAALVASAQLLNGCGTNPVTGKRELQFISEAAEIQMGQQNYAPMRQSEGGDFRLDTELTPYVNEVGQKLAAVSDRKLPYEFVVLNSSVPNAWAIPGGKIAINRGLLTELKSEAELAAVLGHEIVHAAARHGAKAQERGTLMQVGLLATQIGLASSNVNQGVGSIALQGAGLGAQMLTMKYGRDNELEADHYGMLYMKRAGYDLQGAITLQETFVKLSEDKGKAGQSWIEGWFASHPPSPERVAKNLATAAELGATGGEQGAERYLARTAEVRKLKPAYDKYDAALAAANKKDYAAARKLATEAVAMLQRESQFPQLLGDLALAEKQNSESLPHYEKAMQLNAGYFGSWLGAGIAQYRLGNKSKSEEWLKRSNELLPTAPAAYFLGTMAKERGDSATALQLFQAAAASDSEYGQLAAGEFQRMDLSQNPANYVAAAVQPDASGRPVLLLQNRSSLAISAVEVTPFLLDANGNVAQQGQRRAVTVQLPAGQTVAVDSGLGNLSADQLTLVRFRVDAAR
jgi:beta-barrel assembly-enhancing protease